MLSLVPGERTPAAGPNKRLATHEVKYLKNYLEAKIFPRSFPDNLAKVCLLLRVEE